MKPRTLIRSVVSLLLFLAGILLQIAISVGVLWGELEARLDISSSVNSGLKVKCPYILSFDETGTIRSSIMNTLDREVQPLVTAEISQNDGSHQMSQTLTLAPHESKTVKWKVDASDRFFHNLILVSVLQGKYEDLPARRGYCSIFLLNFFGMSGQTTFALFCLTSFVFLGLGAVSWVRNHLPFNRRDENIARAFGTLAGLTTMGLFSGWLRWWGLILLLDAVALMLIVVIMTEVLFNPQQRSVSI